MRYASTTKSGPGRFHRDGLKKAKAKTKTGAGFGFVQHMNPEKRARRDAIKAMGRRQYLKLAKGHDTFKALVA